MKRFGVAVVAALLALGTLGLVACGGGGDPEVTVSDLEGTWTGNLSGYERAGYRDSEVTVKVVQTRGNSFKIIPTWTEANGEVGTGPPSHGFLEPSENDFWIAGDDNYCFGEVEGDGDEIEYVCLEAGNARDDKLAIGGTLKRK